jgi:3-hydroxyisobutyrate dehydrogenase-like beta-hydroxyacid dehydrogenase
LVADIAAATGTRTPMADHARELYRALVARGLGDIDSFGLVELHDRGRS